MEKIIGLMGAMREEIALLCERMTDKGGNRCGRDVLHRPAAGTPCGALLRRAGRVYLADARAAKRRYFRALRAI